MDATAKSELYATMILATLACHAGALVRTADLAQEYRVPPRVLERVLQALRRAGIVRAVRGPRGGFVLAHRPVDVSFQQVGDALVAPVSATPESPAPTALAVATAFLQRRAERQREIDAQLTLEAVRDLATRFGYAKRDEDFVI